MKIMSSTIVLLALTLSSARAQEAVPVASAPPRPVSYTISLSADQLNLVASGLSELPWKSANPVLATIHEQFERANAERQALAERQLTAKAPKPVEVPK